MRNIIAERVLGLPPEIRLDKDAQPSTSCQSARGDERLVESICRAPARGEHAPTGTRRRDGAS